MTTKMLDESQTTFKCLLFYESICFTDPWMMSLRADKTIGDCVVSIDSIWPQIRLIYKIREKHKQNKTTKSNITSDQITNCY